MRGAAGSKRDRGDVERAREREREER